MALLARGGTLGILQESTPAERDALYSLAHGSYTQARYGQALPLFAHLVMLDHHERRYLFGLAATLQMMGRHAEALPHYIAATVLGLHDPEPPMRCGECLQAMGRVAEAKESFELALSLCVRPAHGHLRARSLLLLNSLLKSPPKSVPDEPRHNVDKGAEAPA
jgi:type III secretion system low calcium response chaperone LcrH/SycD